MSERKDIVSYLVFEGEMTRLERMNHRLFILCLALMIALICTNAGWIYYESQWEYFETEQVTESYEASADRGGNAVINGDGEVHINGESEKDND